MIVFLILGGIFIIVGYIMGVRKFIKAYQYRGKAEGVILDYENSTGTGKKCEVRHHTGNPEKSYLKTSDRLLQSVIATVFFLLGGVIMIFGIILPGIII